MQVTGSARGVTVYDDFAHHPSAIRTAMEGLRQLARQGRILAGLEPRSSTMKRGVMKDALALSVEPADRVYVYTEGLSWDAPAAFANLGARARCVGDLAALVAAVAAGARAGDHVCVMARGGLRGMREELRATLGEGGAA